MIESNSFTGIGFKLVAQISDLEKAETELKRSLGQFPSAKARFYLDRVRKALLEEEPERISPPKLLPL